MPIKFPGVIGGMSKLEIDRAINNKLESLVSLKPCNVVTRTPHLLFLNAYGLGILEA